MTEQTLRLSGKYALVTGAGKGIGKAIALAYAREGATVSCAARTLSDIQETVGEIEQLGARGLAVQADVTKLDSVRNMVEATVESFGGLDILVVNAGGNLDRSAIDEGNPADWVATLDVNLTGAYYTVMCAVEHMKQRGGGKMITIGSGMGHNGRPRSSAYSVAKAGLWMLTRVLAQELVEHNISVNELVPGPVMTERAQKGHTSRPDSVFNIGSEWIKEPEDVAPLALFLATQPERGPTSQSFSLLRRDT